MEFDLDIARRKRKQKITAVYGAILLVLAVLLVLWVMPNPTCSDGKKNGVETGVDCGGLCGACPEIISARDVEVVKTAFVASGSEAYDLVVWLKNPNEAYGAKLVSGSFLLSGEGGKSLGEVRASSFLLPGETKYIVKQGIASIGGERVVSVTWKMGEVSWVDMQEITGINLNIVDRKYEEVTTGVGFSKVTGLLRNDSTYDWNDVGISIVLLDRSGNLLAVHGTSRQTFRSGEKWDFQLVFPVRFPGDVADVTMQAETNVYNNENFLKANLPGGRFQSL